MLSTPFGAESSHEEQRQIDALTKRPELTSAESSAPLLGFSFSLAILQQFIVKSRDALRLRLVGDQSGGDDQFISSPRREALLNAIRSVRVYEMKDVACISIRGLFVAPERSVQRLHARERAASQEVALASSDGQAEARSGEVSIA